MTKHIIKMQSQKLIFITLICTISHFMTTTAGTTPNDTNNTTIALPPNSTNITTTLVSMNETNSFTTAPLFNTTNITSTLSSSSNETNTITVSLPSNSSNITTTSVSKNETNSFTTAPLFNTTNITSTLSSSSNETNTITMSLPSNSTNITTTSALVNATNSFTTAPLFNTSNITSTLSSSSNETNITTMALSSNASNAISSTSTSSSPTSAFSSSDFNVSAGFSNASVPFTLLTSSLSTVTVVSTPSSSASSSLGTTTILSTRPPSPYYQPPNLSAAPMFKMTFSISFYRNWTNEFENCSAENCRTFRGIMEEEIDDAFTGCQGYQDRSVFVISFFRSYRPDVIRQVFADDQIMITNTNPVTSDSIVSASYNTSFGNEDILRPSSRDEVLKFINTTVLQRLGNTNFSGSSVIRSSLENMTQNATGQGARRTICRWVATVLIKMS